jgi:hypothetical protein
VDLNCSERAWARLVKWHSMDVEGEEGTRALFFAGEGWQGRLAAFRIDWRKALSEDDEE